MNFLVTNQNYCVLILYVSEGSTELDILHGNSYVLTHEDENGECFLVGDEPWQ